MDKKIRLLGFIAIVAVAIAAAYWQFSNRAGAPSTNDTNTQSTPATGSNNIDQVVNDIIGDADAEAGLTSETDSEADAAKDDNINLDLNYEAEL